MFLCLSADKQLGCFHPLAIMNNAAVNIGLYSDSFVFSCLPPGLEQRKINFFATDVNSERISKGSDS